PAHAPRPAVHLGLRRAERVVVAEACRDGRRAVDRALAWASRRGLALAGAVGAEADAPCPDGAACGATIEAQGALRIMAETPAAPHQAEVLLRPAVGRQGRGRGRLGGLWWRGGWWWRLDFDRLALRDPLAQVGRKGGELGFERLFLRLGVIERGLQGRR